MSGGGFQGQVGVVAGTSGMRIVGPIGRDQSHVPGGDFFKGAGTKGGEWACAWCWGWEWEFASSCSF